MRKRDKVLILCQRRKGPMPPGEEGTVEDVEIPELLEFIRVFFVLHSNDENYFDTHPIPKIEYVSSKMWNDPRLTETLYGRSVLPGRVDYQLNLSKEFPGALEFVEEHKGQYSLIVLQQCPLIHMEYDLINTLLLEDGRMAFMRSPNFVEIIDFMKNTALRNVYRTTDIGNYFTVDTDRKFQDMIIFKKGKSSLEKLEEIIHLFWSKGLPSPPPSSTLPPPPPLSCQCNPKSKCNILGGKRNKTKRNKTKRNKTKRNKKQKIKENKYSFTILLRGGSS